MQQQDELVAGDEEGVRVPAGFLLASHSGVKALTVLRCGGT